MSRWAGRGAGGRSGQGCGGCCGGDCSGRHRGGVMVVIMVGSSMILMLQNG